MTLEADRLPAAAPAPATPPHQTPGPSLAQIAMVLQPLSEATATTLAPVAARSTDYLFLQLDHTGRKFVANLYCLADCACDVPRKLPKEGQQLLLDFDAPDSGACQKCGGHKLIQATWPGVSPAAEQLFNRIPECTWMGRGSAYQHRYRWEVAATDFSALVIWHGFPHSQVMFRPGVTEDGKLMDEQEEPRQLFEMLVKRFMVQAKRAAVAADFKLNKVVPQAPDHWVDNSELPLADYQKVSAYTTLNQDGAALFMDRGTGKTSTAISRICHEARIKRMRCNEMLRVLVVCPNQVRLNWQTEIERFATVPGKCVVINGGPVDRIRQLTHAIKTEPDCAFSIAVIGYESLGQTLEAFSKVQWDMCVADESHMFKSPNTERWKTMKVIRDCSKERMALTGTPIGNSPLDLWTQLEFLGDGLSGFQSWKKFRTFHGVFEERGQHGVERLVGVQNIPLLKERLSRITFQITKAEAGLKLPDKVYDLWEVQMTEYQSELYDRVATQLAIEIEDRLKGGINNLTVENILTSLLRLAQITSGHIAWDPRVDPDTGDVLAPRRTEQVCSPNPKVEAVVEMLQDEERDPNGKTIVWAVFVEDIKAISRRLIEAGIQHVTYFGQVSQDNRDKALASFNGDPACRVMVCNPQTAAEGLNLVGYDWWEKEPKLETYTDHEIFFSQNWSAILRSQAEDRAHRRGTRMPVRITDLVVPNTVDEEIRKRVRGKQAVASMTLDIRGILAAVLGRSF